MRCITHPADPIIFYSYVYPNADVSLFSIPMTQEQGVGDVKIYYAQTPLYADSSLSTQVVNGFATWEWFSHTINGALLPYTDELGIFTPTGNLTAFTNLNTDFYAPNDKFVYEISEAQGIFIGRRHVVIEISETGTFEKIYIE